MVCVPVSLCATCMFSQLHVRVLYTVFILSCVLVPAEIASSHPYNDLIDESQVDPPSYCLPKDKAPPLSAFYPPNLDAQFKVSRYVASSTSILAVDFIRSESVGCAVIQQSLLLHVHVHVQVYNVCVCMWNGLILCPGSGVYQVHFLQPVEPSSQPPQDEGLVYIHLTLYIDVRMYCYIMYT